MPDLAGPFDGATFAQAPWYRDRGPLEPSGVVGAPAATAAGGELGLTAAGFGLTLALGRAHVRGAAYERTGTAWTDTVPANTSTAGPRNDLVVLRRNLTAKTVTPVRVQGTAAATPADPAITQAEDGTWDLPLFRVQAPPSSGTPLVVTDLRPWLDAGGHQILPVTYAATFVDGGSAGGYDGLRVHKYGTRCLAAGSFQYNGGGTSAGGTIATLPAGVVPTGITTAPCIYSTGAAWQNGMTLIAPDGTLTLVILGAGLGNTTAGGRVNVQHEFRSTT